MPRKELRALEATTKRHIGPVSKLHDLWQRQGYTGIRVCLLGAPEEIFLKRSYQEATRLPCRGNDSEGCHASHNKSEIPEMGAGPCRRWFYLLVNPEFWAMSPSQPPNHLLYIKPCEGSPEPLTILTSKLSCIPCIKPQTNMDPLKELCARLFQKDFMLA